LRQPRILPPLETIILLGDVALIIAQTQARTPY
jgi:hypothetical protein